MSEDPLKIMLTVSSIQFDRLESLDFDSFDSYDDTPFKFFQISPLLSKVRIHLNSTWESSILHLPWAQLASLYLTGNESLTPSMIHAIL
jgi:hypothetical protein